MPPLEVSREAWICRFIPLGEWDDELERPTPSAFKASDRQLSAFHTDTVRQGGSTLRDLCIEGFTGAGEAYLQVETCIGLGQGISSVFHPKVYWRPEKTAPPWASWNDAHVQVESPGGHAGFPTSYRSLLAENAACLRAPDPLT